MANNETRRLKTTVYKADDPEWEFCRVEGIPPFPFSTEKTTKLNLKLLMGLNEGFVECTQQEFAEFKSLADFYRTQAGEHVVAICETVFLKADREFGGRRAEKSI